MVQVEFISEGSGEGDGGAGFDGGVSLGEPVHGHMRAHGGAGVEEGSAVLDEEAVECVGVVGGPELWGEGEDAGVEASSSRGASFDEEVGETVGEPLVEVVESEDIAVGQFALSFGGECGGADLGHFPVGVPLHVVEFCLLDYGGDLFIDIVDHLGA